MTDKNLVKEFDINKIRLEVDIINPVENLISEILLKENFNKLNNLQNNHDFSKQFKTEEKIKLVEKNKNIEFVSVNRDSLAAYSAVISEKEFFKIVGLTKNGLSKRSGRYQQSLYSYYIQALEEADEGFIYDILNKAVIFDNNLKYVRKLMKDRRFRKEWRENFGSESAVNVFKTDGSLKKINIIYELSRHK